MRIAIFVLIILLLAFPAHAGKTLNPTTDFPWQADFSNSDWEAVYSYVSTSLGASVTTVTSGGWDNTPYVEFVIGNQDGAYAAMGEFFFSPTSTTIAVRYLLYISYDLLLVHYDPSLQPKHVDWRDTGQTRCHLSHWYNRECGWGLSSLTGGVLSVSCESSPGTAPCGCASCGFTLDDWYDEWICVEHVYNVSAETYTIYVTTQDSTYNETAVVCGANNGTQMGDIQYLGHYGYNSNRTSSTLFRIGELIIDDSYIGPPSGFANGNGTPEVTISYDGAGKAVDYLDSGAILQ